MMIRVVVYSFNMCNAVKLLSFDAECSNVTETRTHSIVCCFQR